MNVMDGPMTDEKDLVAALGRVAAALGSPPACRTSRRQCAPLIRSRSRACSSTSPVGAGANPPAGLVWAGGDPARPSAGEVPPAIRTAYGRGEEVVATLTAAGPWEAAPTWLALPLPGGLGEGGVLALQFAAAPPAEGPQRAAYRVLARLAGAAVENAQLRRAALRTATLDSLLEQITVEVTSTLSLSEILERILTHLTGAITFAGGSIALITPDHELEIVASIGPLDEAARRVRLPVGQGIAGWVAAHGQPYLSNDLDEEDGVRPAARAVGTNRLMRSYLAVPLLVEGRVIGILQVNSPERAAYTAADLALLAQVALRCANAVAQARLFTELQTRAERLAILNAIGRRISSQLDLR